MKVRGKRATLKSIATDLGVTPTSVSNAYNNPSKVSKALAERIIAYAKEVNYDGPNPAARSLRTGRCGAIGVLFNDQLSYAFTDAHDLSFLRGISSVCEEEGENLVLIPLKDRQPKKRESPSAIVDGYILNAPYNNHPMIRQALAGGLPTVVVDFDAPELASVQTNDREMMREVTEHLLALGHRKVAIVTFPGSEGHDEIFTLADEFSENSHVVHERVAGCRAALDAANVAPDGILVCETENSEEGGERAAERLLSRRPDLTALICFSDRLARGAIAYCGAKALSVPSRISVTGFDGLESAGQLRDQIQLTTVRQNAFEKGRRAAELLLREGAPPGRFDVEAMFVIGGTSADAWEMHQT